MDKSILRNLEQLGFTPMEAAVYAVLVQKGEMNGSRIARELNVSRSSVYASLETLYNKGTVYAVPGDTNMYRPRDPEELLDTMKKDFSRTADSLRTSLKEMRSDRTEYSYLNIKGTKNFLSRAAELLRSARKEVYMNTCINLDEFGPELEECRRRGVRVIVFSFDNINPGGQPVEFYRHPVAETVPEDDDVRLMMVCDMETALIGKVQGEEILGTFTRNPLLVSIVSEHIHNDIYLLRLKQEAGREIIRPEIRLDSLMEKRTGAIDLSYPEGTCE